MKERPIIFSAEMVRAILENRKTQTRRVIVPQPPDNYEWLGWITGTTGSDSEIGKAAWKPPENEHPCLHKVRCPYGKSGDRLWVRETWWIDEDDQPIVFYAATDKRSDIPLKPSIHMPKWASRLNLEIVNIRVERVQDITEKDAIAEGIYYQFSGLNQYGQELPGWTWNKEHLGNPDYCLGSAEFAYANLWNEINAKHGYPWEVNPWVWVVEFKKVED